MKTLITGAAGFIGAALAQRLLDHGDRVIGVDNLNDYYDVALKEARLVRLATYEDFRDVRLDVTSREGIARLFADERPQRVMHLAARAGVRDTVEHPHICVDVNLVGFSNVLEACRRHAVEHLVYASTSMVYGAGTKMPFSIHEPTDHPVSLYAATKRANELMAHTYSHLFAVPTTGLRFFTVYGPWGRPDMALFKFTRYILKGEALELFHHGRHRRDFIYIDDLVEGMMRVLDRPAAPDPSWEGDAPNRATSHAPYRIYNIGSGRQVELRYFIELIEQCLGRKAKVKLLEMQPGDVPSTHADVEDFVRDFGYRPETQVEVGIRRFVDWYKDYYKVS